MSDNPFIARMEQLTADALARLDAISDEELERHRNGDFCEACGADRGDGYCQECPDDPDRPTN